MVQGSNPGERQLMLACCRDSAQPTNWLKKRCRRAPAEPIAFSSDLHADSFPEDIQCNAWIPPGVEKRSTRLRNVRARSRIELGSKTISVSCVLELLPPS